MMNKRWFRLSALVLALVMLFAAVPAVRAEEGTLTISTAEEFLEFAESCTLDSWSRGKTVRLTADISLANTGFTPIPTFGGTFEGDGHTITGLEITDTVAPAGLFARLQADAVVRNLNLEGSVCPDGEKTDVGGLAGVNSGTVENCTFTGTVSGKRNVGGLVGRNLGTVKNATASGAVFGTNSTGGLVGCNLGLVQDSRNKMYVNIESTDPGMNLDELSLNFSLDLSMLSQIDTANVATDTGGAAGYSSGTVDNCVNYGAIGHQHIGYNVGGVVGRSSGAVKNCSNEGSLEKGIAAYKEAGVEAHGYVADVTDEAAVNAMVAKIKEEVGPVDILVNNAGLMKRVPMIEMSHTDFLRVIDVHVGGAFNCSKAVLPDMIAKREGKIINICSMMSELGRETVSAYAAAKGALKMLTKNIASEYGEYNIQCNGMGPGYIATAQTAPLRETQPDGSRHPFDTFICAKTPAGRWGNPEDMVGPCVFLASHASDFVNGQILYADGGILAYIGKQPK